MSNKTVWDAVNEFNGVWPYDEGNMIRCTRGYSLFEIGSYESYSCCHYSDLNTGAWEAVCSRKEFNELVAEMSNNFGKPKAETKRYWDGREKLEVGLCVDAYIDSTKTQTFNGEIVYIGQSFGKNHYVIQFTNWLGVFDLSGIVEPPVELIDGEAYQFECDGATFKGITTDRLMPVERAVYTQEMADNGVLPSVGMECLFKHGGYDVKGVVTAITNEYIVLTENSGKEHIRKLSESPVKPITPPKTDKEKAIDDMCYAMEMGNGSPSSVYKRYSSPVIDAIIAGKIHGVTWSIKDEN